MFASRTDALTQGTKHWPLVALILIVVAVGVGSSQRTNAANPVSMRSSSRARIRAHTSAWNLGGIAGAAFQA